MGQFIDLTGKKFGRLMVLERVMKINERDVFWKCKCECDNFIIVRGHDLRNGHTRSCGCLSRDMGNNWLIKHGCSKKGKVTREYKAWLDMKARCLKNDRRDYKNYGGRGIYIDPDWLGEEGFEHFLKDMGKCPKGMSLDRIDNDGPYSKENCRWTTRKEQNRNQRSNIWLEYRGIRMILSEWARFLQVKNTSIKWHLKKNKTFEWIVEHFMKKNKVSWEKIENYG